MKLDLRKLYAEDSADGMGGSGGYQKVVNLEAINAAVDAMKKAANDIVDVVTNEEMKVKNTTYEEGERLEEVEEVVSNLNNMFNGADVVAKSLSDTLGKVSEAYSAAEGING